MRNVQVSHLASERMTDRSPGSEPDPRWPTPEPGQTRVMLLGCYHMANPGHDEYNLEADDVLEEARQRELEALTTNLADWEPDCVAVEWPRDRQDEVDDAYEAYRAGDLDRLDGDIDSRDELVQVGCRLADRLGHDRVRAIDHKLPMDAHLDESETVGLDAAPDPDAVGYPLMGLDAELEESQARLAESTVAEYLRYLNRERQLRHNGQLTFASGLAHEGDDHAGARLLTAWYERNLRILENLWGAIGTDDERVLVVIGSAHVRPLRHFLDEAPMTCPVSPIPYL